MISEASCDGKFRKLNKAISSLSVVPGTIFPSQHYSPGIKKLGFGLSPSLSAKKG